MKQQDKIFDLFRNNQHKLNERPSLQTWNKLERKLNQKNSIRKGKKIGLSIYSIMMMAAAAVALVFFVTTLANVAQTVSYRKAIVIQENMPTDQTSKRRLVAEQAFREKYQDILNNTVEEGTTGRLIVTNKPVRPFLIPKRS